MKDKTQIGHTESHFNRITFYLNGHLTTEEIESGISTLDWLHQKKHLFGTKCSCNEGDCGACTVVIASPRDGLIVYEAINSCLYPAAKLQGRHLITIEALGTPDKLHPIQQALLEHHGTQCGYCTPGFVMSMFALFAMQNHPDKEAIFAALEGNLCRCTGYQSILEAATEISEKYGVDNLLPTWCREVEPLLLDFKEPATMIVHNKGSNRLVNKYLMPENMKTLFEYLRFEGTAVCIAGGTDLMVQMNIGRKELPVLIDLTRIAELNRLYLQADGLHIGACVSYAQLAQSELVQTAYPFLHKLISLIASQQIRNFGTLGGNIANASPVGDSLPLLLAMDVTLRLQTSLEMRQVPIREFFTGYRKTALQQGEIIKEIILPVIPKDNYVKTIKSAKRKSLDISAVVSAINVKLDLGYIKNACLAWGGVAAIPLVSHVFTELVVNKPLASLDIRQITKAVAAEFKPLSDVRGSAVYRSKMIENHLQIYLTELQEGAL